MSVKDWIDLGSRLLTVLAGLCGVYWTVKLALRRFQAEKWWELQSSTYVRALEDLAVIKYCFAAHCDAFTVPVANRRPSEQLENETTRAFLDLEKIASVGPYILSETAIGAVCKVINLQYNEIEAEQYLNCMHDFATQALEIVRAEAQPVHKPRKRGFLS